MAGPGKQKRHGAAKGKSRKAKRKDPPPLSDLDKARTTRERGTQTKFVSFHPSIGVLYLPWRENEDGNLVMFIYPNNHNTVNPKKVIEIMNNLADNPMQILNSQPREWGSDMWFNWYHHDLGQNIEDLPKEEKIQLRAVAKTYSGDCPWVAVARPHDEMKSDWFNDVLNDGGLQHMKINAWTEEGIAHVVSDNGWEDVWGEFEKKHTAKTLISEKYTDLLRCSARNNNKWKIRGSPKEGLHRTWSAACIATKSPPNAFTATLNPGQLKVVDFLNGGLKPRCIVDDRIISEAAEAAITGENPMLVDSLVKMSWFANYNVPADEMFEADRIESGGVAEAKLNVAHPNAGDYIGTRLAEIMKDIPAASFPMTPNFENSPAFYHHVRVSDKEATETAGAGQTYEQSELFEFEAIDAYIRDPITKSNYQPAREALSCPAVGLGSDKVMVAPHPVSYRSMVREEAFDEKEEGTKSFSMTCESANAILVVPVIVAHLLASINNESPRQAIKGSKYLQIVLYVLNFHLCTKSGYPTNNTVHGCMKAHYGLPTTSKANVVQPMDGLIGAIMYIFHTWTATVMHACDVGDGPNTKSVVLCRNADMFEGAMKSMEVGRLKSDAKGVVIALAQIQAILSSLSKEYINKVKTGPFKLKELSNHGLVCMTFLHKLVYLLQCNEVMKVIQMHGLFPQPSDLLQSMSPDLYSIYELKIQERQSAELKKEVTTIFEAMGRNKYIKIQNHITRSICKTTNTHDVETSLLPYYLVMMACHVAEQHLHYQNTANGIPMFVKGSIIGPTNSATDQNHTLNNLILRTEHKEDDDWDEYKVKRLADLQTIDQDCNGSILSLRIAAKGCFRPINDTLTNTEDHNQHVTLLTPFTLPLDHADYDVLLEMNRDLKEERKKGKKKKGKKGGEDDEDELEEVEDAASPSAATPGAAGTGGSDAGTGGSEAVSASDGSGNRRTNRVRKTPTRYTGMLYRKSLDDGGTSEDDENDGGFSDTSPPKRKKLRFNDSGVSSPSRSLVVAQANAFATFMNELQRDPAYAALTQPVVKYFQSTFGSLTPRKKAVRTVTSFADMAQAAIDLTKEEDEIVEDHEQGVAVKMCTRDEIIQRFKQINFQHRNPTNLSSQPGIDTINATLGIKAAGMVDAHHIRYKDEFVFVIMSKELCHSVWSKWIQSDGKPLSSPASIIFETLLDYSSRGWKISLFVNTEEPKSDLVVLVTDETYDHLTNNKLAKVYKPDGGNSGSEEGSDDADSSNNDEDNSVDREKEVEIAAARRDQMLMKDGEEGESNDDGDETMEETTGGGKESGNARVAVEAMDVEINDGNATNSGDANEGAHTGDATGDASQATQAVASTSQKQPESRDKEATNEDTSEDPPQNQESGTVQQQHPGDDMQDELGLIDRVTSPNADKIEDANTPTEATDGDNEGNADGRQDQSRAGDPKESVEVEVDDGILELTEQEKKRRATRSKSPQKAEAKKQKASPSRQSKRQRNKRNLDV